MMCHGIVWNEKDFFNIHAQVKPVRQKFVLSDSPTSAS